LAQARRKERAEKFAAEEKAAQEKVGVPTPRVFVYYCLFLFCKGVTPPLAMAVLLRSHWNAAARGGGAPQG
jgi:hypothetical protein